MSRQPRTCFVINAPRRSGLIRGVQIASALGAETRELASFSCGEARRFDIVVWVKELPGTRLMEAIRGYGVRQVIDVIDNFRWRKLGERAPLADALVAANRTHGVALERRFGRVTVVLPHHHCNMAEERIPPDRDPPTLGYIGRKDDWLINRWLTRSLSLPLVRDFKHGDLRRKYLGIDLGFAYRSDRDKRSYNSAVKLLNYMSFGIPAVVTPESGFLEVARHGEECLFAQTGAEMPMFLDHLAQDPGLRRRLGDAAFEAARPFHIDRVADMYRRFLGEV